MANENDMQQAVLQMQYLEQQMNFVQQQINAINGMLSEVEATLVSLGSMKGMKADANSLSLLGSGVYANSVLKKSDTVLVEMGGGVVIEKTIAEAVALMENRQKSAEEQLTKMTNMASSLESQYMGMAQAMRGK